MRREKAYLILAPIFILSLLFVIEQFFPADYVMKTLLKIGLMIGTMVLYFGLSNKSLVTNFSFRRVSRKTWIISLCRGVTYFGVVLVASFILSNFLDFNSIIEDLQSRLGITPILFLFVGIYITFFNSLLEESFFRGFIFLELMDKHPLLAASYSSFLFAIYHIGIILTWAPFYLVLIAIIGLFFIGFIFCLMDVKSKSIVPSWLVHMFADAGIIFVGLILFGWI